MKLTRRVSEEGGRCSSSSTSTSTSSVVRWHFEQKFKLCLHAHVHFFPRVRGTKVTSRSWIFLLLVETGHNRGDFPGTLPLPGSVILKHTRSHWPTAVTSDSFSPQTTVVCRWKALLRIICMSKTKGHCIREGYIQVKRHWEEVQEESSWPVHSCQMRCSQYGYGHTTYCQVSLQYCYPNLVSSTDAIPCILHSALSSWKWAKIQIPLASMSYMRTRAEWYTRLICAVWLVWLIHRGSAAGLASPLPLCFWRPSAPGSDLY